MKTLPVVTEPWGEKIERRHTPRSATREGGYEDYRSCLRWEFDFSCAFCLCHESDLRAGAAEGATGTGIFSIEHFILRKERPDLENDYRNCFHCCRYCNRDRGGQPHLDGVRRLLNPCDTVWADCFVREGDELKPKDGDSDARYTHDTYRLDSAIKRRARRLRRERILEYDKVIRDYPDLIDGLRRKGVAQGDPNLIKAARELWEIQLKTIEDTRTYLVPVPQDAQYPCPCKKDPPASLRVHASVSSES
jgi:hypothetical protein